VVTTSTIDYGYDTLGTVCLTKSFRCLAYGDEVPRPRRYTTEPSAFGKAATIGWVEAHNEPEADRLLAAQHQYAVRINARVRVKFGSLEGYAEAAGLSYDGISKIVRGEALMRLEDLANAERVLGIIEDEWVLGQ
jgi:hypothetical protein